MNAIRLPLIVLALAALARCPETLASDPLPIAPGPFRPTTESLQQYQYPEWFRDAKLGIWAHWGPQAVPMAGDWYAKHVYVQGNSQYKHHLDHFGHPSTNGYKDIIPLWKAEKFDPDRLMRLYQKAGARYFVSMGVHHDNFDLWNSKHQRWNAVQMGPHRDIVGAWQAAARKRGLKFGVSEHLGASFTWFQVSHGADKDGPFAGVPYDGANPAFQDLYHFPAAPGDTAWYSNNPRWHRMWFDRIQDLVDQYHPDLLYTDGGMPFGNETGAGLIAHFYNSAPRRQGTHSDVVYTCKQKSEGRWVEDLERGVMNAVQPHPWQTDTSIGDWYYNKNWKFRKIDWVIHMLVDIVSKNGNLLLNVVQKPDGSLDPEVEIMLGQLADWMKVHGEGIHGTRPWVTFGEGPVQARGGHFKEDFAYGPADIRFTVKGDNLYAFAMGWPTNGQLLIRTLAQTGTNGTITRVKLLGSGARLAWKQTPEGLSVTLPPRHTSDDALALRIQGRRLSDFQALAPAPKIVLPDTQGVFTLTPDQADLHGNGINTETRAGQQNIGFWDSPEAFVTWKISPTAGAKYRVTAFCAAAAGASEFALECSGKSLTTNVPSTGGWDEFRPVTLGELSTPAGKELEIRLRPVRPETWKAVNLRTVRLERIP